MKIGETLAGRYELRKALASGRGTLFIAHDRHTNQPVAVKVFDSAHVAPEDLRRYAARIAAATAVVHPAVVVPRVQVATSESPPFVVGELLRGEDLGSLCARLKPVPWSRALAIAHACAEGLAALAAATGMAHRALRPGNIWLTASGQAQVLDFGIAELGAPPVRARTDGTFVEYRAPEQLGGASGNASSDVFSLGVLLFEMVTGIHPFSGTSAAAVAIKMSTQPAPTASQLAPHIELPASLTTLIGRMLARRPKDRLVDPASLARELAALLPPESQGNPASLPQAHHEIPETPRPVALNVPSPASAHSATADMPPLFEHSIRKSGQDSEAAFMIDRTLASPRRGRLGFAAGERTEILPRTGDKGAAPVGERTEVLPRRGSSRPGSVAERTEALPCADRSITAASGERTEELPVSGRSNQNRDDERTQTLQRVARPSSSSVDEDARTQTLQRLDRPPRRSTPDAERTQVLSRTDGRAPRPAEETLLLPERRTSGEATETLSRIDLPGTSDIKVVPVRRNSQERQLQVTPLPNLSIERAVLISPRKILVALNLILGLLIVAGAFWMWIHG